MELRNEILDDYTRYCERKILDEFKVDTPTHYEPIYSYQRYKCRIIDSIPREVKEANSFIVPNKFQSAYTAIKSDIEAGNPLRKYQSRKLKQLDYDDDMLSHWGIQHLHLSLECQSDGFVKRTGELLFVHFDSAYAHIIGIFNHRPMVRHGGHGGAITIIGNLGTEKRVFPFRCKPEFAIGVAKSFDKMRSVKFRLHIAPAL